MISVDQDWRLQGDPSRTHTLEFLFPGAFAPSHVLQTAMIVAPLEVMRDMQLFIQGILDFA